MERRSFLKWGTTAIAGGLSLSSIGSSFVPGVKNASSLLEGFYQLPAAKGHVRHGLFNLQKVIQPALPTWLEVFEQHRFFKDGVSESGSDFKTFTCSIEGTMITLGYDDQEVFIIEGEEVMEAGDSKKTEKLHILRGQSSTELLEGRERVVIVLEGKASINEERFASGEFLVSDQRIQLSQTEDQALSVVLYPS